MTYTERRIAKKTAESPEYKAAFEEEEALVLEETERRQQLMSMVAAMRKAQHLSQQQLAEKMKVSQARISQMERGREPLSVDSLLQMIEVLQGEIVILAPGEIERYGLRKRGSSVAKVAETRSKIATSSKTATK